MEKANETKLPENASENETETSVKKEPKNERSRDGHSYALAFVMTAAVSMALGAGGFYLSNKKKIEFADRYALMLETEDYMENVAEIGKPENPSDSQIINAYLSLYGDEYTLYEEIDIKSKDFILSNVNNSASANGTGFELDFNENDELFFSKVIADMPADEQGIEKGDIIVSVDGKAISEYEDAKLLKSSDEKTLDVLINRNGEEKNISLTIYHVSDDAADSVTYKKYGDVLYIDYNYVNMDNESKFLEALNSDNYDSIIIDVRNNSGGQNEFVMQSADMFVDKAELHFYSLTEPESSLETNDGKLTEAPIVILTNENTASAAEIFTSLLKQYADTTIVGTTTFGKGIYQTYGIFHGNSLHYTDGYFTVGDWECWQDKGISADVEVEMNSSFIGTDNDIQLDKALELLS